MARHSKWANIKHRKAAADSKKGKVFTRMAKLITVAAQQGGGDVEMNPALRLAIQRAKAAGVPNDNIDRALKKGTGELTADRMEEMIYEGYGPGGVALMIRCLTDNTNRSFSNLREIMKKNGGSLGVSGCVSWMFARKGVVEIESGPLSEADELLIIEAGAEDLQFDEGVVRVLCPVEGFEQLCKSLEGMSVQKSELAFVPMNTKEVNDVQTAEDLQDLLEKLEGDEDVDEVFCNAVYTDGVLKTLGV